MPLPKVLSPKRLSNPLSLRVRDSSANASFTPVRSANQRHWDPRARADAAKELRARLAPRRSDF